MSNFEVKSTPVPRKAGPASHRRRHLTEKHTVIVNVCLHTESTPPVPPIFARWTKYACLLWKLLPRVAICLRGTVGFCRHEPLSLFTLSAQFPSRFGRH